MKTAFGWIVGIVVCAALMWAGSILLKLIGVPTYIDFGETITVTRGGGRYSYEEELDGASTAIGSSINFIAILIGMYAGVRAAGNPVTPTSYLQGKAVICGLAIYGVGGAILFKLFPDDNFLSNLINNAGQLGLLAASFFVMRDWYRKQIAKLSEQPKAAASS